MGNFKIEIEAVGGHGAAREIKQGEHIDYAKVHEAEPDRMAFDFVCALANNGCSVSSAKLVHWPDTTPIVDDLKNAVRSVRDFTQEWDGEAILEFFSYSHLPEHLQAISKPYCHLAYHTVATTPRNAERSVALRKLLEAKDAAVRAAIAK